MKLIVTNKMLVLIKEKAKEWQTTEQKAFNYMVGGFSESTLKECSKQVRLRDLARRDYLKLHSGSSPEQIWTAGHYTGWHHFQLRKANHPFKKFSKLSYEEQRIRHKRMRLDKACKREKMKDCGRKETS